MATEEQIKRVKRQHSGALLSQPGVSGVGIEKDESGGFVLAVHVDSEEALRRVPEHLEGVPVRRIRSGPFTAGPAAD
jgi:hypothetical protein